MADLFTLLGDPANFPFAVALGIVVVLALIEGVGLLIGTGIFSFLDTLLPDVDVDFDIDAPDLSEPSMLGQFLTWLRLGQVPVIFSLIIFLMAFGLIGLISQSAVASIIGTPLPAWIAIGPVFIATLPVLSLGNAGLARVMPRDETSAVSQDSLVGRLAIITTGEARADYPAQAKVKDQHNLTHYVMVAPDLDTEVFPQGEQVLIVRRDGTTYYAIHNPSDKMTDVS